MNPSHCLNCEVALVPNQKYCMHCGQRTDVHRLGFHDLSHDAVHAFMHADKSIFSLVRDLIVKPGIVAREYVAGKRTKYFKPFVFFLLVAGLVVFITSSFYKPNSRRAMQIEATAKSIQDPERKQQLLQKAERVRNVGVITGKYSNVINMVATPFLAFLFWIFYRKQYNYVEALVANMYFTGLIMIVYALLIVPLQGLLPQTGRLFIFLFFLFEISYRGYAYYQFSEKKGAWPIVKAYGISFLISAIWVALTFSLIATYIRSGF